MNRLKRFFSAQKKIPLLLCLASLSFSQMACQTIKDQVKADAAGFYPTARLNFEAGKKAYDEERFEQAVDYFDYVKNKFPYSKFSTLSDLLTADCFFAQENWLEAADSYRFFTRFHPRHKKVVYASYRVALSYHKATHTEMFNGIEDSNMREWIDGISQYSPFPPEEELDQTAVKDEISAWSEFIQRYPNSEHTNEAKIYRTSARAELAAHEIYSADFYYRRGKYRGALWRYLEVARHYRDTKTARIALKNAAEIAEYKLSDLDAAVEYFGEYMKYYPSPSHEFEAAMKKRTALKEEIERLKAAGLYKQKLKEAWDPRGYGPWKARTSG